MAFKYGKHNRSVG